MQLAAIKAREKGKHVMDTSTEWLILVTVLVLLAIAGIAAFALLNARSARRRHAQLQQRFGPEYERAVEEQGSVARAERELRAREKRVGDFNLRTLPPAELARFSAEWRRVQARFVDDPGGAVQAADDLIKAVMLARGYSVDRFDQRVADLSVEHAGVVQHYRAAGVLAAANREGRANTEELRQAVVHYRALFADLLEQPEPSSHSMQEARI
jgi:hypothetical protein